MSEPPETTKPAIAEWLAAYARWFPDAIMKGETNVNDAFRAGYLAAILDMRERVHAD